MLADIRAALAAATPGPWSLTTHGDMVMVPMHGSNRPLAVIKPDGDFAMDYENAWLVAHAPTWLAWQAGEIERLTKLHTPDPTWHCHMCGPTCPSTRATVEDLRGELDQGRQEIERLRGALGNIATGSFDGWVRDLVAAALSPQAETYPE